MKVLLISVKSEKSNGGISVWTKQYLKGCSDAGIDCDLVNTEAVGKIEITATSKRNIRDELIRTRRINKQLKNLLNRNAYDVAHLNTSIGLFGIIRDYYVAHRIVKRHIPLVVHFHCDIPYWVRTSLIHFYLKKTLKLSGCNLVLCESSRRYLKQEFHAESVFIPNFVNEKLIVEQKSIHPKLQKICFVGRVSTAKGAREIFEVAQKFPEIQFSLAGAVSEEVSHWDKPSNIELLGSMPHDEIIKLLDKSDLFLFPSHTEGFSLALVESMARGVPSVATDVGANADMIENKGGRILSVEDVKGMKAAIVELEDAVLRRKMSAWCVNKVRDNYTIPNVMKHFAKIYQSVMEKK